ncbi:unnamed protein product [Pleuronectes platessa]|uniref:Uncharacterized protein n=1 Tax=Pleuronectes platessa TaxID=8262 RepID=A0A9N7UEI4_PLEPL|nr:unnamed protein product [Pleuronectes platessa]
MFTGIWGKTAGHVPRLGKQSPRRPPLHATGGSVCIRHRRFFVLVCGASWRRRSGGFLSLGPRGGVRHWCGRRAVGGDRVRRSAAATLDAFRRLLADHFSYGARCGNPPFARGAPSGGAPRLAPSS